MEMTEDYWMEQAEKEGKIVVKKLKGQISAGDIYDGWFAPADVKMVITTPDSQGKRDINIVTDYKKDERIIIHLPYDDFKTIIDSFIKNGWWV